MDSEKKREIGLMAREAFDVEVTRIAQEKLHPHECDPVVYPVGDGITRFVIRVQGGEFGYNPGSNSCRYSNWST